MSTFQVGNTNFSLTIVPELQYMMLVPQSRLYCRLVMEGISYFIKPLIRMTERFYGKSCCTRSSFSFFEDRVQKSSQPLDPNSREYLCSQQVFTPLLDYSEIQQVHRLATALILPA